MGKKVKNLSRKPKLFLIWVMWVVLVVSKSYGQEKSPEMLLMDMETQAELADAVDLMYNFQFQEAEQSYQKIRQKHPEHPLPYFLMGLSNWWKIVPNIENKSYDDAFMAYMDSSITKAEKMYQKNPENVEACFFLAGAYGFKGRLNGERENWIKATAESKNAFKYLKRGKGVNELSPEFLFGDALYNYFSVWIGEEYPLLKAVTAMFPKGDKSLGLKQLDEVSRTAFYTRTEAKYYLLRIYTVEESKPALAWEIAKWLYKKYPMNAYFHKYYAMILFSAIGNNVELEKTSLLMLERVEKRQQGYGALNGRYASYYLGYIAQYSKNDVVAAEKYYLKTIEYAESIKAYDSGYYLSALEKLAKFAQTRKDYEQAEKYYEKLAKYQKKRTNRKIAKKERKKMRQAQYDDKQL